MTLPILAYGNELLRKRCEKITPQYPGIEKLLADMWETMEIAHGCGLSAPQIGLPIRLFIVDSKSTYQNLEANEKLDYFDREDRGITEVFINAHIIERSKETWEDVEGCLSIPELSQTVCRPWSITIAYYNQDFEKQFKTFSGATARMIQHEYDHIDGILFFDHLKPLTKRLIGTKLKRIAKGRITPKYPMRFAR